MPVDGAMAAPRVGGGIGVGKRALRVREAGQGPGEKDGRTPVRPLSARAVGARTGRGGINLVSDIIQREG